MIINRGKGNFIIDVRRVHMNIDYHRNWFVVFGFVILPLKSKKVLFFMKLADLPWPRTSLSRLKALRLLGCSSIPRLCINYLWTSMSFLGLLMRLYSSIDSWSTATFWPKRALPVAIKWSGTYWGTLGGSFIYFRVWYMLKIWSNSSPYFGG